MRAYSNMPTHEFVAQLRDIAIKAGARPLVIDQIDALADDSATVENIELAKLLEQAEKDRDNLLSELEDLVNALQRERPESFDKPIENAIKIAESAIEKHSS